MKIGDKVIVVDKKYGHMFEIGEELRITYKTIGPDGWQYYCENKDKQEWVLGEDEIVPH